jgi:tetraacyldisaccharide 4'-kinase
LTFGALTALRRLLYRTGLLETHSVGVPVVVVGNVIAGGSGKTPVVLALVQHLQGLGLRVGVISRGYGRSTTDCREVLGTSQVVDVGDEPALIKHASSVPVFVAQRRFDAASSLLSHYPDTQLIICDDGLQHLALRRDLEICVFDDRGVGNGFLLPAGPLREPWPRATDLVLHTGSQPAFAGFSAQRRLASFALRVDGSKIGLNELAQSDPKPLLAVAAIAKPDDFFSMLRAQGLKLARTIGLPDHHDFADWSSKDYSRYTIVCTEKDAVKLWQREADALAVPLVFRPEPDFLAALDARLAGLLANNPDPNAKLSSQHGYTTS